jgi:DNA-binding Lrp family transcriptional regulator
MKAFILINIRTGEIPQVVDQLNSLPGITEAHMTLGPYDAIALIEGADVKEIGQLLAETIQPVPGILDTLTCLLIDP